jgi:ABC-type transport system involved in cytochrome c biogenesis permease subunit
MQSLAAAGNPQKEIDLSPVIAEAAPMVILDNGRAKPLATYARYTLFQLSGRYSYKGASAISWLCKALFTPQAAAADEVFLINNPEAADAIGIAPQKKRRYSFNQIGPGLDKLKTEAQKIMDAGPKTRSAVGTELLRTVYNVQKFTELCSVFSFPASRPGFIGSDTAPGAALNRWANAYQGPRFSIVPVEKNGGIEWQDLLGVVQELGPKAQSDRAIVALVKAAGACENGAAAEAAAELRAFNAEVGKRIAGKGINLHVATEVTYDAVDPFFKAKLAYFIALALLIAGLFNGARFWPLTGGIFIATGFLLHTYGTIARVIIMHRPPVTTLYETFVFVAWMSVLLGLLLELFQRKGFGHIIASFTGALFLHFAGKFGADGDTMGMLAPVLNNNFWLATHIMTISMGYAGCFGAGVLAHFYLVQRKFLGLSVEKTAPLASSVYGMLAFGLTLTTIGTVLGGLWADQAWGRFWGWDPKENGALLIIVWCAIIFHGRKGRLIKETGTAVGAVVGLGLVMLAWLGVNLLGIGMHAYGFTAAGAKILFAIVGVEVIFLAAIGIRSLQHGDQQTNRPG